MGLGLGRRHRRLRIAVPLILLIMILMRLVWMQLRAYPVVPEARALVSLEELRQSTTVSCDHARGAPRVPLIQSPAGGFDEYTGEDKRLLGAAYDWLASPGYVGLAYAACHSDLTEERHWIKMNQWILAATVLMATLMARFITSSWTIALTVAAMLMSRGRLLADIGSVSTDYPVMLLVTTWLACCAHYLRTGAIVSLVLALAAAVGGAFFDRSLVALCVAMPVLLLGGYLYRRRLARPVIRRLRGTSRRMRALYEGQTQVWPADEAGSAFGRFTRSMRWVLGMEFPPVDPEARWRPNYERGSLLRTINVPFLLWAYHKRRWLHVSLVWLTAGVAALALLSLVQWAVSGDGGMTALVGLAKAAGTPRPEVGGWLVAFGERFDLHLATSLVVMVFCAVQSPAAGLTSFLECTWLALVAGVALTASAFLADAADAGLVAALGQAGVTDSLLGSLAPRPVMLWLEPVVLSLGVAGIYNLMKVLDTRMADKG